MTQGCRRTMKKLRSVGRTYTGPRKGLRKRTTQARNTSRRPTMTPRSERRRRDPAIAAVSAVESAASGLPRVPRAPFLENEPAVGPGARGRALSP